VAARFTLDALPGKQMSIDADLAAGIINDTDAKQRRSDLARETEFFGAMDGASKFVRGDAMAGLAITGINLVGGLLAGLLRDHLSLSGAVDTYTLLTVGDGLVSQLPALLVSTASGVLVTRAAGSPLGTQVGEQVFGSVRALRYAAGVLGAMALLPGLPLLAFGGLAAGAWMLSTKAQKDKKNASAAPVKADAKGPERLQDLLAMDALELEVGYALLPLIDLAKGGELPGRVTALRKQLATDLGIVLPSVHLRDNMRLDAQEYRVRLRGLELARGRLIMDRLLTLDPAGSEPSMEGIRVKEPAFGLPAVWIPADQRSAAEALGYTLVDPASVVTTHLAELLRRNAHELVGRQEVQELLGACAKEAPKLVEDAIPGAITLGELVRVVRNLLREGISIRDLRTILEAVADAAPKSKDTAFLTEQCRRRLSRQITAKVSDGSVVHALTLDRPTEDLLRQSLGQNDGEAVLSPDLESARRLVQALETRSAALTAAGRPAVLIAPADLRRPLFDFASRFVPELTVISARELVAGTTVEPAGMIQSTLPLSSGEVRPAFAS
jgi:flagellar biosynthesis protein FlhA